MKSIFIRRSIKLLMILLSITLSDCHKIEPPTIPVLSTMPVTNITATTATGGGNITSDGNATIISRGVCWGTLTNPTISESKTIDGNGTGQFVSTITSLNEGITYHLRAYSTNSVGTAYGADVTFTTLGQLPSVITQTATNVSATGATLNGEVNANSASTTVSFEYGLATSYGKSVIATPYTVTGTSITRVNANISGLTENATYHYRVKAVNSLGITYGNDISFIAKAYSLITVFYDGFDTNLNNWTLFGDPIPIWVSSLFGKSGLFDNNGDPNYNNGAISNQTWEISSGFTLESEIYLDFSDLTGCWAGASIGFADPVYQSWGGYNPTIYFDFEANGDACWASPSSTFEHAILIGGYLSSTGSWETFGDLSVAPIYADSYLHDWRTIKIMAGSDMIPKFYIADSLIYAGQNPISNDVFAQPNKIWLGDRSSGSAGKAYHNWVKLQVPGK